VIVLPDMGRVDRRPTPVVLRTDDAVSQEQGQPEGDLADIRRYAPGDPLKRILWKPFARTRQVLVRMPERAVAPTNKTHYYFVAGEGDEATAGVARAMIERRADQGEFEFGADGADAPETTTSAALELIARSRQLRASAAAGLPAYLAGADASRAGCVLFVPPKPGPWLERVTAGLAQRPDGRQVVVGFDGERKSQSRLAKILTRGVASGPASISELRSVCEQLAQAGVVVLVVHRGTGEPLEPAALTT
jgi:hypothetical protein